MKKFLFLGIAILSLLSMKTDKPAYRLFDQNGRNASYKDLVKEASEADIVFFGELHDNPICHWLEYELIADLFAARGKNLVLGAEMFESDNQLIVNEYLDGLIKEKDFESQARLWPNYKTDYKRLLNFARDSSLAFIATNIPRRYAAMVNKSGFDALNSLDQNAYPFIAPLPLKYDSTLSCYADMYKMMGEMFGAFGSQVKNEKNQEAFKKWRNDCDKLLAETKDFATKREECIRFINKVPYSTEYKESYAVYGKDIN